MQDVIDECIQSSIVEQIRSCSAYGLMVDESTDVTITKKLVIYVKIVNQCHTKTCFLANIDIVDGRAETIYDTILNWAGERNISLNRCVGFGSDGTSVMVGIRSGVATRLKIESFHCVCALCCSQVGSYYFANSKRNGIFVKIHGNAAHAIYNYFHNSAVCSAKLHQVQEALEELVRSYKEVFSVRWLSLYTAVDSVVQSWQSLQTTLGD